MSLFMRVWMRNEAIYDALDNVPELNLAAWEKAVASDSRRRWEVGLVWFGLIVAFSLCGSRRSIGCSNVSAKHADARRGHVHASGRPVSLHLLLLCAASFANSAI